MSTVTIDTETINGQVCVSTLADSDLPLCNNFKEKRSVETNVINSMIIRDLIKFEIEEYDMIDLLYYADLAFEYPWYFTLSQDQLDNIDKLTTQIRLSVKILITITIIILFYKLYHILKVDILVH